MDQNTIDKIHSLLSDLRDEYSEACVQYESARHMALNLAYICQENYLDNDAKEHARNLSMKFELRADHMDEEASRISELIDSLKLFLPSE